MNSPGKAWAAAEVAVMEAETAVVATVEECTCIRS